jgi:hypothetical protein
VVVSSLIMPAFHTFVAVPVCCPMRNGCGRSRQASARLSLHARVRHLVARVSGVGFPDHLQDLSGRNEFHRRCASAIRARPLRSSARSTDRHGSGTGACLLRPSRYTVVPAGFALRNGSLATAIEPWLEDTTQHRLVVPVGDAVDGALRLARAAAESASDHNCAAPPR